MKWFSSNLQVRRPDGGTHRQLIALAFDDGDPDDLGAMLLVSASRVNGGWEGNIHELPVPPSGSTGAVHIWRDPECGYEISHESSGGNSWGASESFPTAVHALLGACRLNRRQLRGQAKVRLSDDVIGDLQAGCDRRMARGTITTPEGDIL